MPVQTSDPLEQKVGRAKLGHHYVEIHVKRLLKHLRSDNYQPAPRFRHRIPSDTVEHRFFSLCALGHYKLRVHQDDLAFRERGAQLFRDLLRLFHGIHDDAGTAAPDNGISD